MIVIIDNYDSFTYNLYHYIAECGTRDIKVFRNDEISVSELRKLNPEKIILSPGPCTPNESGICLDVIKDFKEITPIFGVCLGHQAIGQVFGGNIIKTHPMHGKISKITHNNKRLFKDIKNPFNATRYHSLTIDDNNFPESLEIDARSEDGVIMAVSHKKYKIYGVQFHPESIASEFGHKLIQNFLDM